MKRCATLPAFPLGSQGPLPPNTALLRDTPAQHQSSRSGITELRGERAHPPGMARGGGCCRAVDGRFSANLAIIAQAPALSWPLELRCLLFKGRLPLCQEELERTLVLGWFCSLGETPEAETDEYQMRTVTPVHFLPSDLLPGTLTVGELSARGTPPGIWGAPCRDSSSGHRVGNLTPCACRSPPGR